MSNRKNRNTPADPNASAQAAIDAINPAATDAADAPAADNPTITPISMSDFMTRDDRADWLSIREAAKRIHGGEYDAKHDQTVRNAAKKNPIFSTPDARVSVEVDGYDIPPLTYLNVAAIDAYHEQLADPSKASGRTHGGAKRWIVRLTPDQVAAYNAGTLALTHDVAPLEAVQSGERKPKASTAAPAVDGAVSSDAPPAGLDFSTPADEGAHETSADIVTDGDLPADLQPVNADWQAPVADAS